MEAVAAIVLGAVVFMQAWQFFGLSQPKTTGIVAGAGAIALASLAVWKPLAMLSAVEPEAFSASVLVWAIYAALVAGVGLWNFDPRGLGFYSAIGFAVMIGQIVYCIVTTPLLVGAIGGGIQAVAFGMLFFYLAIPMNRLLTATSWVLLVVGSLHVVLGGAWLLKVPGLA